MIVSCIAASVALGWMGVVAAYTVTAVLGSQMRGLLLPLGLVLFPIPTPALFDYTGIATGCWGSRGQEDKANMDRMGA